MPLIKNCIFGSNSLRKRLFLITVKLALFIGMAVYRLFSYSQEVSKVVLFLGDGCMVGEENYMEVPELTLSDEEIVEFSNNSLPGFIETYGDDCHINNIALVGSITESTYSKLYFALNFADTLTNANV